MDILFKTNNGILEALQTLTQKCNCRSDAQLINKKIQTQLQHCYADHDKTFIRDSHHEWAFMGSPTTFPNNCNMADGCHIELRKNANNPYQMKICAHNFVKDATLDRLRTTTARRLSACNVVDSV